MARSLARVVPVPRPGAPRHGRLGRGLGHRWLPVGGQRLELTMELVDAVLEGGGLLLPVPEHRDDDPGREEGAEDVGEDAHDRTEGTAVGGTRAAAPVPHAWRGMPSGSTMSVGPQVSRFQIGTLAL